MSQELPSVAGRRLSTSIAALENRCLVHLANEQEKLMPDNALIAVLCDAVRLGREYADEMNGKVPASLPVTDGVWDLLEDAANGLQLALQALRKSNLQGQSFDQVGIQCNAALDRASAALATRGSVPKPTALSDAERHALLVGEMMGMRDNPTEDQLYLAELAYILNRMGVTASGAPPLPESPWKGMEEADPKETILMQYQGGFIGSGKKDTGIRNGALRWMPLPVAPESPKGGEDA